MRKLIIIFLCLAFSLQAQNYFGHGQTQASTTFSDSMKVGGASVYINLTPATVGGMLNITAGTAANWTGLKISGSGFNNSSDNYILLGTAYTWKADGALSTAKLVATDSLRVEKTTTIKGALTLGGGTAVSKMVKNAGSDSLFFICGTDTFVCVRK